MKIGNYARTNYGTIVKIEAIDEEVTLSDKGYIDKENIIKSSPNVIDLIEVGDYVNGHRVVDKQYHYTDKDNYDMGEWCIFYENVALGDYQYDIKSIVTREMFENMEYKL